MVKGHIVDPNIRGSSLPVDLIRTVAIVLVILLHAAIEPYPFGNVINQAVVLHWWTANIYNSLTIVCVPLFVMLSGALLLQPYKVEEPLKVFFKKRFIRIGPPLIFWIAIYFLWRDFANHETLTLTSIAQGIVTGPSFQFWYIYMLIGLYLVTPLLRVLVAHANRNMLRYFLILWFLGTSIAPIAYLFVPFTLNNDIFLFTGWVGYFLLGLYLVDVKVRPKILYAILIIGFSLTAIGTYLLTYFIGGPRQYFFYDYLGIDVVVLSASLFLLLKSVPSNYIEKKSFSLNKIIHFISASSLAIFLIHVIVLESIERGYFGFRISITTMNPIVEIPLATAVTLLICLGILYPVSKVPILKKIVGITN
jgi:surface polysaccharide O-acyltransferase-like enzyme